MQVFFKSWYLNIWNGWALRVELFGYRFKSFVPGIADNPDVKQMLNSEKVDFKKFFKFENV